MIESWHLAQSKVKISLHCGTFSVFECDFETCFNRIDLWHVSRLKYDIKNDGNRWYFSSFVGQTWWFTVLKRTISCRKWGVFRYGSRRLVDKVPKKTRKFRVDNFINTKCLPLTDFWNSQIKSKVRNLAETNRLMREECENGVILQLVPLNLDVNMADVSILESNFQLFSLLLVRLQVLH